MINSFRGETKEYCHLLQGLKFSYNACARDRERKRNGCVLKIRNSTNGYIRFTTAYSDLLLTPQQDIKTDQYKKVWKVCGSAKLMKYPKIEPVTY